MKGSLCRLAETSFLWRDTAMRIRERFNPRAPCGARRHRSAKPLVSSRISTHAPLAGRDPGVFGNTSNLKTFQPTRPLRGATNIVDVLSNQVDISTHAPLAGRDNFHFSFTPFLLKFQPTRPLRGATDTRDGNEHKDKEFQPTRPLRGATKQKSNQKTKRKFQPTRPLRGATARARAGL